MPAKSRAQQRFFGMVRAAQKGEMDSPSPEVAQAASSMKKSAVKDFASTKHKKLPEKKVEEEYFFEEYDVMDLTEEEIIDLIERKIPTSRRAQIARAIADRVPRLAPGLRMYALKKDIEKAKKTRSWSKADRARETGERYITSAPKNEGLTFQEFLAIVEAIDWDKSQIGLTGQPVPKRKWSAAKQHEFEKKRREHLKKRLGEPGDSPMIQALRKKAQDTGNYAESYDEILDEKYVKSMDSTGRGADRRAHTTDPSVRPTRRKPTPEKYKHSEAEFDSTLRSPSARKRKDERRQGVGGFREEYDEIDEAKVDWVNRDKENVQHRIDVLRDRNRRLQKDNPELMIPSGKYQTDFRRKRHTDSRGKKKG